MLYMKAMVAKRKAETAKPYISRFYRSERSMVRKLASFLTTELRTETESTSSVSQAEVVRRAVRDYYAKILPRV